MYTFPVCRIAGICCADIVVIAILGCVPASTRRVAGVCCADIIVVADDRRAAANLVGADVVRGAGIVVIAGQCVGGVYTMTTSGCFHAFVGRTNIVVIALQFRSLNADAIGTIVVVAYTGVIPKII